MMKLCVRSTLGAVALSLLAASCGSIDVSTPASGSDGIGTVAAASALTVLEADEAAGKLRLQFVDGTRAITYELLLGAEMHYPPSAEELSRDPELPTFEVDAQVRDAEGEPIQLQIGGDTFMDSSWSFPRVEHFDEAQRLADIQRMRAAVPALRALRVPASLEQLRLSALQIGLGVEQAPEKPAQGELSALPSGTLKPQAIASGLTSGPSSVKKWDYRLRVHSIYAGAGQHSSVNLRGWSASAIVFNANSCNHGGCADNTNNTTKCTMSGFLTDDGTHTRFFYIERSSNNSVSGGCTTLEEWDSTRVLGDGAHNCNDDSELQIKAIHADSTQCRTCGSCGALGLHNFAPACH